MENGRIVNLNPKGRLKRTTSRRRKSAGGGTKRQKRASA
jgi:hypothetical protein